MRATAPPLVVREAELGVFERALAEDDAGRPSVVGLAGEPGIGFHVARAGSSHELTGVGGAS